MRFPISDFRFPIGLVLALALWWSATSARADGGEAGLVVQNEGKVDTYCVALPDGGMNGEQLLSAAGYRVEALKTSSGNTVCALNDVGCFAATDFNSCFCKSFPPDSTYWAFFVTKGGKWQYSSIAADRVVAHDGDVQGWKWGKGGPQSAPAPVPITFEQICGHAAGGGGNQLAPVTNTAAVQETPTAPETSVATTVATSTNVQSGTPTTLPPSAVATITALAVSPTAANTSTTETSTVTVTAHGTAKATPAAPATGKAGDSGGNGSLLAFGVIAVALVSGIAGALWWRRGHGR